MSVTHRTPNEPVAKRRARLGAPQRGWIGEAKTGEFVGGESRHFVHVCSNHGATKGSGELRSHILRAIFMEAKSKEGGSNEVRDG